MNLISILIVSILAMGAFIIHPVLRAPDEQTVSEQTERPEFAPVRTATTETDTDGDGVKDWEEKLRGTDPKTPDRARESAVDAVVIRLSERRAEKTPVLTQPTSETRQETEIPVVETEKSPAVETREAAALHAFGNALGAALAPVANDRFEEQMQNILNAVVNDGAMIATLAPLAEDYRHAASALAEVAPPASSAGGAAALLGQIQNGYTGVAAALAVLGGETEQKSEGWMRYSDAVLALGQALNQAVGFFRAHGVEFASSEPGALFGL